MSDIICKVCKQQNKTHTINSYGYENATCTDCIKTYFKEYYEASKQHMQEQNRKRSQDGNTTKVCLHCGAKFRCHKYKVKRKYCSCQCSGYARRKAKAEK